MTALLLIILVIFGTGSLCLGLAVRSSLRERSFRQHAQLHDAVITGYTQDSDDRYRTLYKFTLEDREVHGVFPDSIPEPIMRVGETLPLYVKHENPTQVLPAVSQKQATIRTFNYLLGSCMLLTAVPLLLLLFI